jgi:uncharacterized protein
MESYHPKRKRDEITDDHEINRLLMNGKYVTIAMSKGNMPYVVTLSYGYDKSNNCLYFHCANQGDKLDHIRVNDNVCGTIIEDRGYLETKCDHAYSSLIIRGQMVIVADLEEKRHGLGVLLNHLEKDPKPILERNIKDDKSYDGVTILKLIISSIIGKKHAG